MKALEYECVFILGSPETPHLCYQCGRTRAEHGKGGGIPCVICEQPLGSDAAASHNHLIKARFFERGWERAVDARALRWGRLSQNERKKITNRWSLAAAREIVASGQNVPPLGSDAVPHGCFGDAHKGCIVAENAAQQPAQAGKGVRVVVGQEKLAGEAFVHTPGPWYYEEQYDITDDDNGYIWAVTASTREEREGGEAAYVQNPAYANSEANARLIAAAPELLEALLDIRKNVRFAREHSTNPGLKELATIIEARTEVAKQGGAAL